jgi:tetratricopeptide (TPR) repeat protein
VAQEKGYVRVEALTLHNLGRLYRNLGREEKALQYLESSLALWRKVGDQESMARTMAVLGRLGYELGHLSKAHDYFEEALQIRDEIGHKNEVVETLSDLAVVTLAQGDVERAQTLIDQSLFLGEGLPGPGPSYAYARYRSAEMAEALGDVGKAMAEAEEALKIYENFGIKYRSAEVQGFIRRLKHETKS